MAKISALTAAANTTTGAETLPIVQSGATVKATINQIRGFKTVKLLVSQTSTGAPTATVIENTTGVTPVFARSSAGVYTLTMTGAFTVNKTFIPVPRQVLSTGNECTVARTTADVVSIQSFATSGPTSTDGLLSATPIEIQIYL
jgi:hypothetical protein